MAWWPFRRRSSIAGAVDDGWREVIVLRLVIDVAEESDLIDDRPSHVITQLEEHMPELEEELRDLIERQLGPEFAPGKLSMHDGSIVLVAPIRSIADAVLYYVGLRQAFEWLLRDFRSLVNRWVGRHARIPMRVRSATVIQRQSLREPDSPARLRTTRNPLLTYLIVSHALLLATLIAGSAVLLAHAV